MALAVRPISFQHFGQTIAVSFEINLTPPWFSPRFFDVFSLDKLTRTVDRRPNDPETYVALFCVHLRETLDAIVLRFGET